MKRFFALFATLTLCAVAVLTSPAEGVAARDKPDKEEKVKEKFLRKGDKAIPEQFIVVLDESVTGPLGDFAMTEQMAELMSITYGGKVKHIYKHALGGYAVNMSKEAAIGLSNDPRVLYVEEDGVMQANVVQSGATWGLDRIDQRNRPLSGTYTYNWTGAGVTAYVIDTGIRTTHSQFGGRAAASFDAFGGNGQDCNGHGTHVAGTIGGSIHGVAKSVQLRAVRVLNCSGSGSTSGVIAGVDWVRQNHAASAVANMSLGGPASSALDTAINNLHNSGVTIVVAAGNENQNACNVSPARAANAVTTGSTTSTDARSSFSNFGTCVDIFAPGSSITSAWYTSTTATATISGTSMASPHVCGVAALYKQANPSASPTTIRNALVNNATTNVITNVGSGSPNRLLYSLFF
jgi:subtilisin family serine protease